MNWRLVAIAALLLVLGTGCPHAWGRGGTIDRAAAKDLDEMLYEEECELPRTEWEKKCADPMEWEMRRCPPECQIDY